MFGGLGHWTPLTRPESATRDSGATHPIHVEERVQLVDLVRSQQRLRRVVPALPRHLVTRLVQPRRRRREADTTRQVEPDLLQRQRNDAGIVHLGPGCLFLPRPTFL